MKRGLRLEIHLEVEIINSRPLDRPISVRRFSVLAGLWPKRTDQVDVRLQLRHPRQTHSQRSVVSLPGCLEIRQLALKPLDVA